MKDKHLCGICKTEQIYYGETWLCPKCDSTQIWDVWWTKEFLKGNIMKFEKV